VSQKGKPSRGIKISHLFFNRPAALKQRAARRASVLSQSIFHIDMENGTKGDLGQGDGSEIGDG
jgi:hypothetical protein